MPPGVKKLARPRSMGSYNNPCTISSEEDSEADQIEGTDEEYVGPDAKRKMQRRKRKQSAAGAARSSARRKTSLPDAEDVEEESEPISPEQYRQPSCSIIPNIKQNATWKDGFGTVSRAVLDRSLDRASLKRAKATQRQLLDEEVQWGIAAKERGKQPDTRCRTCASRSETCVVQLNVGGSQGGPYQVISSCIRCLVSHTPCDLLLQNVEPAYVPHPPVVKTTPNQKPLNSYAIIPPPASAAARIKLPLPAAPVQSSRKAKTVNKSGPSNTNIAAGRTPKVRNATHIESEVDHGSPSGPEISKDQVVAAVQDLSEFVEHMKTMMNAEGGKKDLGMRGMFQLVDEQVEVLKQFSKQL